MGTHEYPRTIWRVWMHRIEPAVIVRETAASMWVQGKDPWTGALHERRESKLGWRGKPFDSWRDAHAYLVQQAKQSVRSAESNVDSAKEMLAEVLSMKPESPDA